jgi:hypothetical protein
MTTEDRVNAMLEEIRRRNVDYSVRDMLEERRKLVAAWRAVHPEAAAEPVSGSTER